MWWGSEGVNSWDFYCNQPLELWARRIMDSSCLGKYRPKRRHFIQVFDYHTHYHYLSVKINIQHLVLMINGVYKRDWILKLRNLFSSLWISWNPNEARKTFNRPNTLYYCKPTIGCKCIQKGLIFQTLENIVIVKKRNGRRQLHSKNCTTIFYSRFTEQKGN